MPRVMQIIKEEVNDMWTRAPIQKEEMESLARAVKVVGPENVYPQKIGYSSVGDAHWVCLSSTPLYSRINVKKTVSDIVKMANEGNIGDNVALLGGRFVSWVLARELDGIVDQFTISDIDPWVEKVTADNLRSELKTDVLMANSNDREASNNSDTTIICSTIPALVEKMSGANKEAITFI